ncbi:MAG: DNA translocase FtsK 4TM domain-containing protein [Nitrospirota bacterium]
MAERTYRIRQKIKGIVSILIGIYVALSVATYSEWDPSFFVFTTFSTRNYGGLIGSYIADLFVASLGIVSFALPVILIVFGVRRLIGREGHVVYTAGTILFVFSTAVLASLITETFQWNVKRAGGIIGSASSGLLVSVLSIPGAYILLLAIWLFSLIMLSPVSISSILRKPEGPPQEPSPDLTGPPGKEDEGITPLVIDEAQAGEPLIIHGDTNMPAESWDSVLPVPEAEADEEANEETGYEDVRKDSATSSIAEYILPDAGLLRSSEQSMSRPSREEIIASSSLLEQKLRDFGVEGRVTQVQPGPVVTMYEFEPAPGVKINRVVSLSDDLALSLKAQSVRVSTLPGKAAIGIEVPNKNRETVCLREIISSEVFRKSRSKLTLALGKDIYGNPVVADLAKMPHLLVAGATGAGKSVSINSMVMSILYEATPKEVKMLMIDPKLLELSAYERVPHLISPVITNPKEAAGALKKLVFEMERRYRLLAEKGVRNIEGFNAAAVEAERLPYIVVFIDELADLMFASASDVEDSIARLAQMARASGIHLILATQRPSVDVITGIIKANFSARIAFHVTSRIDSRTIIDAQGAEQLLGKGDKLFMLPGVRITRIHGALVTEEEIRATTDFISTQGHPDYTLFESLQVVDQKNEGLPSDRDEMYNKVIDFAESVGEVSISSIQRRFKIGYNKAARIMEIMEEDGLVGPQKGAGKPRDYIGRR